MRGKNRFNDGKCDPAGRFWAGTISMIKDTGSANLYCLDTDGSLSLKVSGDQPMASAGTLTPQRCSTLTPPREIYALTTTT